MISSVVHRIGGEMMVLKFIAAASLAVLAAPAVAQQPNYAASALNSPDPGSLNAYGAPTLVIDDAKVPGGKALRVQAQKGTNSWDAAVTSALRQPVHAGEDRKSTRLNSSHANISYAVFCLKKKNR